MEYLSLGKEFAEFLCKEKVHDICVSHRLDEQGWITDDYNEIFYLSVFIDLIEFKRDEYYYSLTIDEILDPELKAKWQKD